MSLEFASNSMTLGFLVCAMCFFFHWNGLLGFWLVVLLLLLLLTLSPLSMSFICVCLGYIALLYTKNCKHSRSICISFVCLQLSYAVNKFLFYGVVSVNFLSSLSLSLAFSSFSCFVYTQCTPLFCFRCLHRVILFLFYVSQHQFEVCLLIENFDYCFRIFDSIPFLYWLYPYFLYFRTFDSSFVEWMLSKFLRQLRPWCSKGDSHRYKHTHTHVRKFAWENDAQQAHRRIQDIIEIRQ